MTTKQWLVASLLASTCLISIPAVAGPIENYSPVTADRLTNPEPGNWMLIAEPMTARDIARSIRSIPPT
jgi:alcohol dehydrogenase (cytochrome c)